MLSSRVESLRNITTGLESNQTSVSPHPFPAKLVTEELGVDVLLGLSDEEARRRLERAGANSIQQTGGRATWRIFLSQFTNIIVLLLLVATIVAWFTQNELEAVAIFTVIFLNAGIGFFRNPYIFAAFDIVIGLQLFAIYFPPLALVLDIVQPSATDWVVIGLSFLLPILIVEFIKIVTFKKR